MADLHLFYDSNKDIKWSTFSPTSNDIIDEQKASHNLDHLTIEAAQLLDIDKYYVNNAGDDVVEYSTFSPTYDATTVDLDTVINVTGVPSGTEVFLDNVSAGTMSNTTLTLTATQSGEFMIELKQSHYVTHGTWITVKRRGE